MKNMPKSAKPSRRKTVLTLGLMLVWVFLIAFAVVAATDPQWLRDLSGYGRVDEATGYKDYGDNLLRKKNYGQALAQYRKALDINPDNSGVLINMAIAYNRSGKGEIGLKVLRDALKMSPGRGRAIYYNMGDIYKTMGSRDQAIDCYLKSTADNFEQTSTYCNLGSLYLETKQTENALYAFERALEIQTNPVRLYRNMLKTDMARYEDDKENLKAFEQILNDSTTIEDLKCYDLKIIDYFNNMDPEVSKIHTHLGVIYGTMLNLELSEKHFRRALEIWPGNSDAQKNLQILMQAKNNPELISAM